MPRTRTPPTPAPAPPAWALDAVAQLAGLSTRVETARTLRIGLRSLDGLVERGEITPTYVGSRVVFARLHIADYLARSTATSEPRPAA